MPTVNVTIRMDKELKKQAQKTAVTFEVPLAGPLTLNEQDVDKMYNMIMGG